MNKFDANLVAEMKRVALAHPHKTDGSMAPQECLWAEVSFEGETLNIMLTYDLHDALKIWHLSVGRSNHTAAPQNIVDQIVETTLGENYKPIPEHYFPPQLRFMKQYIKISE